MKYYELDVEQFIDQSIEKVFEFFSQTVEPGGDYTAPIGIYHYDFQPDSYGKR